MMLLIFIFFLFVAAFFVMFTRNAGQVFDVLAMACQQAAATPSAGGKELYRWRCNGWMIKSAKENCSFSGGKVMLTDTCFRGPSLPFFPAEEIRLADISHIYLSPALFGLKTRLDIITQTGGMVFFVRKPPRDELASMLQSLGLKVEIES